MKQFGDCRACPPEGGDGHWYRQQFIAADQMWNVVRPSQLCRPLQPREQSDKGGLPLQSGSGGTNAACLAATPQPERWKCLMAEYIAPYLKTPIFVMNSVRPRTLWLLSPTLSDDNGCRPTTATSSRRS